MVTVADELFLFLKKPDFEMFRLIFFFTVYKYILIDKFFVFVKKPQGLFLLGNYK